MAEVPLPYPQPDRDTAPFWEGQNRHELRFQRCSRCQAICYPVGPLCPECRSFEFEWTTSSGRGTIYSYIVVRHQTHPAFRVPYTVVLVEMEEGPRVIAQLRAPEGAPMPNGLDFWWDEEGTGNCWENNVAPGGIRSDPAALPTCGGTPLFTPGNLVKVASLVPCARFSAPDNTRPFGCDFMDTPPAP
jgi:hypothetical protein